MVVNNKSSKHGSSSGATSVDERSLRVSVGEETAPPNADGLEYGEKSVLVRCFTKNAHFLALLILILIAMNGATAGLLLYYSHQTPAAANCSELRVPDVSW